MVAHVDRLVLKKDCDANRFATWGESSKHTVVATWAVGPPYGLVSLGQLVASFFSFPLLVAGPSGTIRK